MSYRQVGLGLPHHLIQPKGIGPIAFSVPPRVYNPNVNWTQRGPRPGDRSNTMDFRGFSGGYFRPRGLADTCQWPQPGVPMYYPACTGSPASMDPTYEPAFDSGGSAYDVPGLVLPSMGDCTDHVTGVIDNNCVAQNALIQQQNFQRIAQYNTDAAFRSQFSAPVSAPPANVPATSPAIAASPRGGQVQFQNLTTGNASQLKVGDQWRVTITGASPNAVVAVTGGRGGNNATTQMGSTDANGTFSINGSASADQVGSWSETWSVGGQPSGSFAFVIAPPQSSPAADNSAGGYVAPGASAGSPYIGPDVVNAVTDSSGFNVAGYNIPWWAAAVAAGGLFLMLGGRR